MKYDVKLAEDIIVRVEAENQEEAIKKANEEVNKKVGSEAYDKLNFNYDTGLKSMKLRGLLGLAEKRDQRGREIEKEQVLLNYVGSDGFIYNSRGDLAITPEGQKSLIEQGLYEKEDYTDKNVIIDETGYSHGDLADLSGIVGPVFGAIAAMSPHLRAVNLLKPLLGMRGSRILAAGSGAALGKGGEEAFETQQGVQLQNKEEIADLLKREFLFAGAGQGVGELIGTGFAAFFGKKAPVPDVRDAYVVSKGYDMDDVLRLDEKLGKLANEKDIAKAVKNGDVKELDAKGAVSQQFLGRAIPGRMQGIGETIAGKQGRERGLINYNMAALAKLQEKLAAKRSAVKEFSNIQGTGAASNEIKIARDKLKSVENDLSNQLKKMMGDLSAETGGFGPIMGAMDSAALGKSVQDTMKDSYKSMVSNFRADYDDAFSAIRNFEVNQGLKGRIKADLENLGKYIDDVLDEKSPLLKYRQDEVNLGVLQGLSKEINKGAYKDGATLSDLIEIRSALVDTQLFAGLRGGKTGEFLNDVLKKVDDIITDAPNKLLYEGRLLSTPDQAVLKNTVSRLKNINTQYFEDMKPFNKAVVQKIITDSSLLGTSADDVYRHILTKNDATGMQDVLSALTRGGPRKGQLGPSLDEVLIGPKISQADKLRSELTRKLFKDAVDTATDPVTGVFNPSKYVKNITQYGSTLRPLLGSNYDNMMSTLNQFNRYSPKLRPEEVAKLADDIRLNSNGEFGPGFNKFLDTLETKAKASDELLQFEQSKVLTNVENATPENIAQVVFRPNSAASINQVKNQVTEEAFLNVQDEALEQLIKKGVTPGGSDLTEIFKPGNFQRALDSYGDETLEAMFGKDLKMALNGFARAMNVTVSGAEKTGAGSIVAGTLAAGFFNLNLLPTVATLTVYKTLFANPRIVSMLSRTDKTAMGEVMDAVEKAIRLGGFSTLGSSGTQATEDVDRMMKESGIDRQIPNLREQSQQIINEMAVPISRGLEIPKISPVAPPPRTAGVSRSLLGGSIANEDIAARRAGGIAGLV